MRRVATQLLNSSLAKFGYRLTPLTTSRFDRLEALLASLKNRGFAPKHVVDVGANRGKWTRVALKYFPDAAFTLVEPQDELRSYIQDLERSGYRIRWIHAGVADKSRSLPFTIRESDDSSNFSQSAEEALKAGFRSVTVETLTLNKIVASSGLPMPEMVKIDAEGFDLKVLQGATDLLGKTEVFFAEASLQGAWENTIWAVVKHMADYGYKLLDVTDLNHSPKCGLLCLVELAFVKEVSPLLEGITYW